ncbi:MAG: DUF559 domain-containing protein [Rudaea sp.]|uniref:DUF559 domain-containing protein n=1 Tax=Rudaea sp. TaxID=2136325 RepID=UPI0039E28FDA
MPLPFEDSRRLTGANLYFPAPGAVLETAQGIFVDNAAVEHWRTEVERLRRELGWPEIETATRLRSGAGSLAITAPIDQLFTATEVNEWALERALLPFSHREKVARQRRMREAPGTLQQRNIGTQKLPFDNETLAFIRELRRTSTNPEHLIWSFVRNRRLRGAKFRRQHAIGPYALDFYCHELKLAIELDGGQHGESEARVHDARRNDFLAGRGIETLRYWNNEVSDDLESVLTNIWNRVATLSNAYLLPSGEGARRADEGKASPFISTALPTRDALPSSGADAPPSPGGRREDFFHAPAYPAIWDEELALHTLKLASVAERQPELTALIDAAHRHDLPLLLDDDALTLGEGDGAHTWPLDALPSPDSVNWKSLHAIPVALVTGSNGKTTTTRLVAAISERAGRRTAFSSTDGVVIGGELAAAGDYSGPAGARTALRDARSEAAVLETARGGILRRGLAVERVQAAIVTNISADHFGEYGVHTLDDLADAKLVVAHALRANGTLVLNADDDVLVRKSRSPGFAIRDSEKTKRLAWFALDADHPLLATYRAQGGTTCGVRGGELILHANGTERSLGRVADMPLSARGAAKYNIANLAGAALLAHALGIDAALIAQVFASFGARNGDNPGRLMRWTFGTATVLMDYAHNPDGLRGLLDVARSLSPSGRLAIVLGQAGNREDADVRQLATVAAHQRPDLVALKHLRMHLRGRPPGDVIAILRGELIARGIVADNIVDAVEEIDAARTALEWARDGDLVVLPIHTKEGRADVVALLDRLAATNWQPGNPLPS